MSELMTDRAEFFMERVAPWLFIGALVFIAYAIAQHLGWRDGAAITIAFWMAQRAHRLSGCS